MAGEYMDHLLIYVHHLQSFSAPLDVQIIKSHCYKAQAV